MNQWMDLRNLRQLYPCEISRAIKYAAPAATLPMNAVCRALRKGFVPVKRPLTKPNTSKATRVNDTEKNKAVVRSKSLI